MIKGKSDKKLYQQKSSKNRGLSIWQTCYGGELLMLWGKTLCTFTSHVQPVHSYSYILEHISVLIKLNEARGVLICEYFRN